jgi:hypothetical protein
MRNANIFLTGKSEDIKKLGLYRKTREDGNKTYLKYSVEECGLHEF